MAPEAAAFAEAEAALAAERLAFEEQWGDGVPAPSGQAAEVRGELVALRGAVERGLAEQQRVVARLTGLREKQHTLQAEADRLRNDLAAAEQSELPLVASIDDAERRRIDAEANLGRGRTSSPRRRERPARVPCTRRSAGVWRSTKPGPAPAPNGWPTSTVCSAPCSTSSRSMPVGKQRSKRPPARRSPPWSSRDATPPAEPSPRCTTTRCPARCWRSAASHALATAPAVGERLRNHVRSHRPEVEQLLNADHRARRRGRRRLGSRRSMPRSRIRTRSSSPRTAIASA